MNRRGTGGVIIFSLRETGGESVQAPKEMQVYAENHLVFFARPERVMDVLSNNLKQASN